MTARTLPCYEPFDGSCHSCGCEAACKDTYLGYICAECRRPCAHCEYPMLDDSGLMHGGELMHIACALEAMEAVGQAKMQDEAQAAYDSYIDSKIDEWRETGVRPVVRRMA